MKPLFFLAASALALSAAACAPHHAPRTALDCPAQQKGLMRISAAADGKSCLYRTKTGDEVQLRLLAAAPTPAATLTPIEQELQAEIAPAGSAPS